MSGAQPVRERSRIDECPINVIAYPMQLLLAAGLVCIEISEEGTDENPWHERNVSIGLTDAVRRGEDQTANTLTVHRANDCWNAAFNEPAGLERLADAKRADHDILPSNGLGEQGVVVGAAPNNPSKVVRLDLKPLGVANDPPQLVPLVERLRNAL